MLKYVGECFFLSNAEKKTKMFSKGYRPLDPVLQTGIERVRLASRSEDGRALSKKKFPPWGGQGGDSHA